jgi:hypothetical protein
VRYLLLLLLLLVTFGNGCVSDAPFFDLEGTDDIDYEQSRIETIRSWEQVYGRITDECYDDSQDVIITAVPPGEMAQYCKHYVTACRVTQIRSSSERTFFFLDSERTRIQRMESVVHEYIHFLQWCEQRIDDPDHLCRECWELQSGSESIESVAESQLSPLQGGRDV